MNARALPRPAVPMLPRLGAARRRRVAVVVAAALIVAITATLAVEWPAITRRFLDAPADPAALAAARTRAVAAAHVRTTPALAAPTAPQLARVSSRVAASNWVADLFASHAWYVPPPPPPPAPIVNTPPPPPTAPPFPYTYIGSYAPDGGKPVFFLSRQDRVLDAHIGDRIDGVYEFESATAAQLVFNYLPLNIRQNVPTGAVP
ncbi:MAG TPA: hypothetical protein VMT92_01765 [Steroidobacteraceae bacterium]|nr:hypothetical protein [Steroidobacteraceae bacterium]